MNFLRLNVKDLQGGADEKIPGQESVLGPVRFLAGGAVQYDSGTIRNGNLWRFKEFACQGESSVGSSTRGVVLLRLPPHPGLLRSHCVESE